MFFFTSVVLTTILYEIVTTPTCKIYPVTEYNFITTVLYLSRAFFVAEGPICGY